MNAWKALYGASLCLLPPFARAAMVDILIQFAVSTEVSMTNFREDGQPLSNGYVFGVDTVNALTVERVPDASTLPVLNVRFEYDQGGGGWTVIGTDADTSDDVYGVSWDVTGLPAAGNYSLRAVVTDTAGYEYPGAPFVGCSVNE